MFASRLTPTFDWCWARNFWAVQITCGSELARESGLSASVIVGCAAAIASKLAPTFGFLYI
ncbi:hypothetical protein C9I50_26765 [Pseudomonas prosekii]|nr:hypothetical protein C9I50_26765 [Pseudomonas prosekii]